MYLVSVGYTCNQRHKVLAHDESILELLPRMMIPFILSHQTGFTKELFDMCTMLCRRGINFYNMESMIIEKCWEQFYKKQDLLSVVSDDGDFWKSPMSILCRIHQVITCWLNVFFVGFL